MDSIQTIILKNGEQLVISKAQVDDAKPLIHFLNRIGGETDFLTFGLNEFSLTVDEEKNTISQCLSSQQQLMLVGKINHEIVSQLFLDRSSTPRLAHIGDIGVSVGQKHWGKSIGKFMVSSALVWAKNNGITKLQLYVRTDNTNAIALYQKLEFTIEGLIPRAVKINQEYFDNYIMGLSL